MLTRPTLIPALLAPYEVIMYPIHVHEMWSQKHDMHVKLAINVQANHFFEFLADALLALAVGSAQSQRS